ncbi:uncharacterized protein LOC106670870 [Cimex lectularius]|uniref:Uncharacterized protein n=1 Tax=Cimex lectularius TaxID=79782 RepID=A0A8I6S6Y6_CIMLE|nr:uncharacterized protein LOC106670870 [Cimex lectularius]
MDRAPRPEPPGRRADLHRTVLRRIKCEIKSCKSFCDRRLKRRVLPAQHDEETRFGIRLSSKFTCLDLSRLEFVAPIQRFKYAELTVAVLSGRAGAAKRFLRRLTRRIKECKSVYDRLRGRVAPKERISVSEKVREPCWCYSGRLDLAGSGHGDEALIGLRTCSAFQIKEEPAR